MAKFCTGDMWSVYDEAELFLITTNSTLKRNGALVMGRGIARQARDRFAGLDLALGQAIALHCSSPSASLRTGMGEYGLLVSPRWPAAKLGAFQVKTHFNQPAQPALIHRSVQALVGWCRVHPQATVSLNFPGIGNGGLSREDVLPIVAQLPDAVRIWEYASSVATRKRQGAE